MASERDSDAGLLERQLSAAAEHASLLEQGLEDSRRRFAHELGSLEQRIQGAEDRAGALETGFPSDVWAYPQRMVTFATGCLALGDELAADTYVAHDPVTLLAAISLRTQHDGRLVYDAVEPPNANEDAPTEAFLGLFTAEALAQGGAVTVGDQDEPLVEILGPGSNTVILGVGDVWKNARSRHTAERLLELGQKVTLVGSQPPMDAHPGIEYHLVEIT